MKYLDDARKRLEAAQESLQSARERRKLALQSLCVCEETSTQKAVQDAEESLHYWTGYTTACFRAVEDIEDASKNK